MPHDPFDPGANFEPARPDGIELNGVANAIMILERLPRTKETDLAIGMLRVFCKYVRAFEAHEVDFWHQYIAKESGDGV